MHLLVKKSLFGDPINFYSYIKSFHTNYNYKTYPSGGNIGAGHTARLHILISIFLVEPRPDMNIKVAAFTVSEKSINT